MIKIKMIQKQYDYKVYYNFTTFIYLKNKDNETLATTYVNSDARLDKALFKEFIEQNINRYGLHVLEALYDVISDYYYDKEKDNYYLSVKNNNELQTILKGA